MNKKILWGIIVVVALAVGILIVVSWNIDQQKSAKLTTFAQCISDSQAKFYGAFWCPHCQAQKALFNTLFSTPADKLPYIECSTPDTTGQLEACNQEKIKTYPTWKFADGSTHDGEMTLVQLSEKTGCGLPN